MKIFYRLFILILIFNIKVQAQVDCSAIISDCSGDLDAWIQNNIDILECKHFYVNCIKANQFNLDPVTMSAHRIAPISIGGKPASGATLTVKQGIVTNKAKITLGISNNINEVNKKSAWGDFVFDDDYELMPIRDVGNFISKEQHLPGFQPGKVIESEGGFNMSDITLKQQIKIEEGFLYLIQLEEKIDKLTNEYECLLLEEELIEFRNKLSIW